MGNKVENCRKGITAVADHQEMTLISMAHFYKTAPMDYTDQDWFVNTAIEITTGLSPQLLLKELQQIQTGVGRTKSAIRFGPRILDLDIIFYSDEVIETKGLTIPHPRMHQRRFVLRPLCDLAPDWVHPIFKQNLTVLLHNLDSDEQSAEKLNIERNDTVLN